MKTKINIPILSAIVSLIFLLGCSEDFLDTAPQGAIPIENFYKTNDDATAAIYSCYNMLQAINNSPWSSLWMMKTFASDEVYSAGSKLGDQPMADEINQFKYGSNNTIIRDVYSMIYYTIYRSNKIIDKFEPDNAYKKAVIAEAKAIRAYMYMELVTLWGSVPLVLHELEASEYQQPQATVAAIWTQIEKDLNEAITDLPLKSEMKDFKPVSMDACRMSKGAAQAFLGKALLYQKKYPAAATALQTVITSDEYTIKNIDFAQVLRKGSEFKDESLFEISFSPLKNNGWGTPNIWTLPSRTAMDNRIWILCGPRSDQGFDGGSTGLNGGWGFAYPTFELKNAFEKAGDTIRQYASIMTEAQLNAKGGKIRTADNNYPWGSTGMVRLKYGTWADETQPATVAQPELNYGTNLRIIRYADVLLMAAEAYNRDSKDNLALPLINLVRQRVKLSDLDATGDALFDSIKNERRLELAFEGSRFQDLIRWGDAATVLKDQCKKIPTGTIIGGELQYMDVNGAGFKSYNVLFPIPFDALQANKKLTPTPGY